MKTDKTPDRLPLIGLTELLAESTRPVEWLIEGVLPANETALLAGQSHSGKTYVALDMGMAVAYGAPWVGRPTKATPVIYCPSEGRTGVGKRVAAIALHRYAYEEPSGNFTMFRERLDLTGGDSLSNLVAHIRETGAGLVIVDVLRDATSGVSENSDEMGDAFGMLRDIGQQTGATILVLHHLGKDPKKGARGHSSLKDKTDIELILTSTEANIGAVRRTALTLDNSKNRNHDPFEIQLELSTPTDELPAPVIVGEWLEGAPELQGGRLAVVEAISKACEISKASAREEGCTRAQAVEHYDGSRQAMEEPLKAAVAGGYVEIDTSGKAHRLTLTEEGERVCKASARRALADAQPASKAQHPTGAQSLQMGKPNVIEELIEEARQNYDHEDDTPEIESGPITARTLELIQGGAA